jgi:hypothetical protein
MGILFTGMPSWGSDNRHWTGTCFGAKRLMFWMRLPGCIPLPWPIMDKDLNRNDALQDLDWLFWLSFQEWLHWQIVIDSFVSFDFGKATLYLIRYPYRHNENGLMMKCDNDPTYYGSLRHITPSRCIDRLSIDNAVFYHGTSPGMYPGTHTFWPLSGDFLDIYLRLPFWPKWRDGTLDETANDNHLATCLLHFCLFHCCMGHWLEMTKQGVSPGGILFAE